VHHLGPIALAGALLLAGCVTASHDEQAARRQVQAVGDALRPRGRQPDLPVLQADSPLSDDLRYALLNHPQVEAAYDDWRGAVLAIGPARALPDPKLTFQADLTDTVTSLMPGFMFEFMAAGKRAAIAGEATAAGEVARRRYVTAVLNTAAAVKKSWIDLVALEETRRLTQQMADLADEAIRFSHAEHATMHAMGSLDQLAQQLNDAGRLRLEIADLDDQRSAARARFKAALGLGREAADPPWPAPAPLPVTPLPDDAAFWNAAQAANPQLGEMRAMVAVAVAEVAVEEKARTPDVGAGLMADLKMNPLLWRPLAEVSLPVWRRKIADAVAAARARQDAAAARLRAEEIMTAAELARMTYRVREADRMLAYLDDTALPNLSQSFASLSAAYATGMTGFAMIPDTQKTILGLQVERVAVVREREETLADLSLLVAGEAPAGAPLPANAVALARP